MNKSRLFELGKGVNIKGIYKTGIIISKQNRKKQEPIYKVYFKDKNVLLKLSESFVLNLSTELRNTISCDEHGIMSLVKKKQKNIEEERNGQ